MKQGLFVLALSGLLSLGYAATVNQPITVTVNSENSGIALVNPNNTSEVCYKSPSSVATGYPNKFSVGQLNQYQKCQSVVNNEIYYGIKVTGKTGITKKTFVIQPGQNCSLKYHWLSGWEETC